MRSSIAARAPVAASGRRCFAAAPARNFSTGRHATRRAVSTAATLSAIIFDADGAVVDSGDFHRQAFNAAFEAFSVCTPAAVGGSNGDAGGGAGKQVSWSEEFHAKLEKTVGSGFEAKTRWCFDKTGWPTTTGAVPALDGRAPVSEEERQQLLDALQTFKDAEYLDLIECGFVEPRVGVLRMMDEAKEAGVKLAVVGSAKRAALVAQLNLLIGAGRVEGLDVVVADANESKIYASTAAALGVPPQECVVVEDSVRGLEAARGAGCRCVVTYTRATKDDVFPGAERIVSELGATPAIVTVAELKKGGCVQDDRIEMSISETGAIYFHIPEGEEGQ